MVLNISGACRRLGVFLGEACIQILCLFLNWFTCLFMIELYEFFISNCFLRLHQFECELYCPMVTAERGQCWGRRAPPGVLCRVWASSPCQVCDSGPRGSCWSQASRDGTWGRLGCDWSGQANPSCPAGEGRMGDARTPPQAQCPAPYLPPAPRFWARLSTTLFSMPHPISVWKTKQKICSNAPKPNKATCAPTVPGLSSRGGPCRLPAPERVSGSSPTPGKWCRDRLWSWVVFPCPLHFGAQQLFLGNPCVSFKPFLSRAP